MAGTMKTENAPIKQRLTEDSPPHTETTDEDEERKLAGLGYKQVSQGAPLTRERGMQACAWALRRASMLHPHPLPAWRPRPRCMQGSRRSGTHTRPPATPGAAPWLCQIHQRGRVHLCHLGPAERVL